jgi:hypothetical protein
MKMLYGLTMFLEKIVEKELDVLQKLKDNLDWFYSHYKYLKKYHIHQFVAVKDKRFLDKDIELERLIKRLKIKDYDDSTIIEFVYGGEETALIR